VRLAECGGDPAHHFPQAACAIEHEVLRLHVQRYRHYRKGICDKSKDPLDNECYNSRPASYYRHGRRRLAIHVFPSIPTAKSWMAGPSPAMTMKQHRARLDSLIPQRTLSTAGVRGLAGVGGGIARSAQADIARHQCAVAAQSVAVAALVVVTAASGSPAAKINSATYL
jgi:hypothetical protein